MKKIIAMALCVGMCFSMAACGNNNIKKPASASESVIMEKDNGVSEQNTQGVTDSSTNSGETQEMTEEKGNQSPVVVESTSPEASDVNEDVMQDNSSTTDINEDTVSVSPAD